MAHRLFRYQVVQAPLDQVFAFFRDPGNLEALTPPWLGFQVTGASDKEVRVGTRIQYRLRLHGIPLGWESRISEYQDGVMFADEQVRGPYRRWYHRHRFRPVPGGVAIEDEVEYRLPLGPLGRLVHWLVVRHQLRRIFDYRARVMRERFGEGVPA